MRYLLSHILIVLSFPILGQNLKFRGIAYDNETHDPMENVKMELICSNFSDHKTLKDTVIAVTNKKGVFEFITSRHDRFEVACSDSRYKPDRQRVELTDTTRLVLYYLNYPGIVDYFPDFQFDQNSATPQDTSLFSAWELDKYDNPKMRIQLTGYYAPNEKPSIARKRAEAVLKGYVDRGANKDSFVIKDSVYNEIKLYRGEYVKYKGTEYFFKRGLIINKKYLKSQDEDTRITVSQLLRSVRLQYEKNGN